MNNRKNEYPGRSRSNMNGHRGGKDNHNHRPMFNYQRFVRGGFHHLNNNRNKSDESYNAFGFKRLTEFLTQTNDEVVMALDKSINNFRQNLRQEDCSDEMMVLLIQIVGEKICGDTSLQEIQNKLVALSTESKFLEKILKFTSQIPSLKVDALNRDDHVDRCPTRILNALSSYYGMLWARMASFAADKLLPHIQGARNISELLSLKGVLQKEESIEIGSRFDNLIQEIQLAKENARKNSTVEFQKKIRKRQEITTEDREKLYQMIPNDDFREMKIIPLREEILTEEEPFLRPNLINGKYPSALTYLDVQFRLLREDFLSPLRESVKKYFLMNANDHNSKEKRPAPGTIRIYRDVQLHKVHCNTDVTLFTMKFSTVNLKRVKWENSKRFLSGSLLILTPDRFQSIYFATVGRRDVKLLAHGLIDIIWEGNRPDTYHNVKFLMIECEVYFESYRHTLNALQVMAEPCPPHYDRPRLQTYKMSKYIVDVTDEMIPPPEYLSQVDWSIKHLDFRMVLQCNVETLRLHKEEVDRTEEGTEKPKRPKLKSLKINPLELNAWPTADDVGMDMPQYVAFQSAITQELAIIQGPPGTGKTYIGLQIMKLLLSNSLDIDQGPILVVCYTNHALDQFLEGILSIMDSLEIDPYGKLVRVGGQSKVEDFQPFNIRDIRNEYIKRKQFDSNLGALRSRTRHNLTVLVDYRSDLKSIFADLCQPNGIVNFAHLNQQIQNDEMSGAFDLTSIIRGEFESIFMRRNGGALFDFLRLNNAVFESNKFSARNTVNGWFKIHYSVEKKIVEADENADTVETEMEDEELLNILVAHRMEEEILEEDRQYKAKRLKYYLSQQQEQNFNSSEKELFDKLQNTQNGQDARRLQGQLYELGLQKNKFMNQCNFMIEFMQNYRDGRIDLPKVTTDLLAKAVWRLSLNEKYAIYLHFIDEINKYLLREIIETEAKIMKAQKKMDEVRNKGDGFILQRAEVVGMTTTGAAKYNTVLRMMQSKIVIVEEAAEVLESHIITSITEHCEHLILIGDHQQLKPPTTVYKLAKDYQLDVSLFERLIKNGISWKYLRAQHRMRPEICKLLVPTIYVDLKNHSSVHNYPAVNGFVKNIFFINHTHPEKADNDSMTKSNEYEAQYITQLCRHLMLQGYKSSQITILTTYIGQMFLIKKLKMNEGDTCRDVRVTVVDNFQGEENDIILLSLVRSNEENKIGFLRTDNRICVALSRAKQGFYIVGNMDCLVNSPSNTWKRIAEELAAQASIGPGLQIRCQNHEDIMEINEPQEFRQKSPEGGCTRMCSGVLPRCDHACRKTCHIIDRSHEIYQCKKDCERHCFDAERHKCPNVCYIYPCPPCQVTMKRTLHCRHVVELPCHIDIDNYSCGVLVEKQLKCEHSVRLGCSVPIESHRCIRTCDKELECGHTKQLPCHVPAAQYACIETVEKDLVCGHKGVMKCIEDPSKFICKKRMSRNLLCGHDQIAPCKDDIASIKCLTTFDEVHPDCKHKIQVACHQRATPKEWKCSEVCDTRLNCGHQCLRQCHLQDDPDHIDYLCKKNCARSCINEHQCKRNHPCHENCDPCKIIINKRRGCGHQVNTPCSVDVGIWLCAEQCQRKTLLCGHDCLKKCSMTCEPCMTSTKKKSIDCPHTIELKCHETAERSKCNELVPSAKLSLCGHDVNVPCRISDTCSPQDSLQYCRQPCDYKFNYDGGCGHKCLGNCASCYQGRIHMKCASKCERVLACGHVCKFPCSQLCPPCSDKCILQCQHSKCRKICGEPCTDCKEQCNWSCQHLKCLKKCSDMCNREPCNERCKKKTKCGHNCIGCCGEPCPPFCRSCDKEIVQELLFGDEDQEDARFVYLEHCGHIIHTEAMDRWMAQNTENSQTQTQIAVKRCPKCSAIIKDSGRYGNAIKKQFKDLLRIRNKIFGNGQAQKETQQFIAQNIQRQLNQESQFKNVGEFLEQKLFQMKPIKYKHGRQMELILKNVDQYTFESLHNIALWWEEAEKNLKPNKIAKPTQSTLTAGAPTKGSSSNEKDLLPTSRTELVEMYEKVFRILLSRKLPLSNHEIDDFNQEFGRIHDLYRLGVRRGISQFDSFTGSLDMYNSAHRHLMRNQPYDGDMRKTTEKFLLELEKIIKIGWESLKQKRAADNRANRQNIFKAMGFAGNHWYRCPNGHLYIVADCGALNQSGTCPECRSQIGGGSGTHAVRDEHVIQQQINNVVDIFPETIAAPPTFNDHNTNRNRNYNRGRRSRP